MLPFPHRGSVRGGCPFRKILLPTLRVRFVRMTLGVPAPLRGFPDGVQQRCRPAPPSSVFAFLGRTLGVSLFCAVLPFRGGGCKASAVGLCRVVSWTLRREPGPARSHRGVPLRRGRASAEAERGLRDRPCGAADTGRESPEAAVCLTCAEVTGADRCDRGFPRHRHR